MNKKVLKASQAQLHESLSKIFEVADQIPDRRPELVVGSVGNAAESCVNESSIDTGEDLEVTFRDFGAAILKASSIKASYGIDQLDDDKEEIRTSVQISRNSLSIYPGISDFMGEVLIDGNINPKLNEADVNLSAKILNNVLNMVVGLTLEKDLV